MKKELGSYDWEEAFKYASPQAAVPTKKYDLSPFKREDVEVISGLVEGENDGESWIIYGKLKDGRWFFLAAWCDYTGWG